MSRIPTQPIPRIPLVPRRSMAAINETLKQTSELASITSTPGQIVNRGPTGTSLIKTGQQLRDAWWYAVLVNAGPNGESDFSTPQYWVQSVCIAQVQNATQDDVCTAYLSDSWDARWIVGTNMSEAASGTHSLTTIAPITDPTVVISAGATLVKVRIFNASKFTNVPTDPANPVYLIEPVGGAGGNFKARITAVTGSFPAWSYTFQRVISRNSALTTAAQWVTDGVNLTGTNGDEFSGTAPYTYGNGATITNASTGAVNSTTCLIKPIGVGAIVDVSYYLDQTGAVVYIFAKPNSAQ